MDRVQPDPAYAMPSRPAPKAHKQHKAAAPKQHKAAAPKQHKLHVNRMVKGIYHRATAPQQKAHRRSHQQAAEVDPRREAPTPRAVRPKRHGAAAKEAWHEAEEEAMEASSVRPKRHHAVRPKRHSE